MPVPTSLAIPGALTVAALLLTACGGDSGQGAPTASQASAEASGVATAVATAEASPAEASPAEASPAEASPAETAAATRVPVDPELFGTHVKDVAAGRQPLPPQAGAIRFWDAGIAWRQLEPRPGQIDWAAMDRAVEQAESTGARDLMWVHGSPPQWAATDPQSPGLYGPGTTSAPDRKAYLRILRKVAERYRGRITSYQVWNEANISIFYRGGPKKLARLTLEAKDVLAEADPEALLIGASTTVRTAGPVKGWYEKYAAGLAERGWPVDAMAVHLYPPAEQGVDERAEYIQTMRRWLAARGWTGPMWDTEVNFGDRRDFAPTIVTVPQRRAAAWVARTYIDSLALGVDRVYWYAWNDHILGIDQVDPSTGEMLPAGQAYLTVQDWFDGARWQGCIGELMAPTGQKGALTTCTLTTSKGRPAQILFTHRGRATAPLPAGAHKVCSLNGTCTPTEGDSVRVTTSPVLIRVRG
ncbi:MAG: hypothetical protein WCF36_04955 [Candidatus Nanopelagicales bacterium]